MPQSVDLFYTGSNKVSDMHMSIAEVFKPTVYTGPKSAVGNMSGNMSDNRCESDYRSRGREFDPSPVPYFHGD